jgi:type IV pilus assembly protein PilP
MTSTIRIIFMSFCLFVLTGCVDWVEDTSDLKRFVADAQAKPAGRITPLPEFKPYHSFVYKGASMREPFTPLIPIVLSDAVDDQVNNGTDNGIKPDEAREKDYLESFALDQLIMVGTITEKSDNTLWALIRDRNAEIHRVTMGNYMGLDFGEIVSLNERKIELIEIVTNGRGGWMKRPRNLALDEQE